MHSMISVATPPQTQVGTTAANTTVSASPKTDPAVRPVTQPVEVSQIGAADALRLFTGQVISSLTLQSAANPVLAEDLGFVPPDNANVAGTQLAGAVRGLLATDPAVNQQVVGQQVAVGIEAGYQETVRLLAQKGPVPADVQIELQQSRELALAAVAQASAAGNTNDLQVAGAQSVQATNSRSAVVTVRTQDGDTVSLQISSQRAIQVTTAAIGGDGQAAIAVNAEQSSEFQFSLSVEGDLDRGETKAIRKLLHQIKGVMKEFAQADYGDAIEKFSKLKLDTEYLANVAMDLSRTRSIAVAGLYAAAATALPAANAASTSSSVEANTFGPAGSAPVVADNVSNTALSEPVPVRYQSAGAGVRLATAGSVNYSPGSTVQQQATEATMATYNQSSLLASQNDSQAVAEPGPAVFDLADLLAPFVSLFRDLLGSMQFSEPGNLIAELTVAMLELQSGPISDDADVNSGSDEDSDTDVQASDLDGDQGAMKTLLRDFMSALDNLQDSDQAEEGSERGDDHGDRQSHETEQDDD